MRLRLDPRDVAAVGRALAAGWRVIACTGRPFPGALPWVERLGLRDPFVCYQGAQVRTPSGERWLDRGIPRDVAAEVIRFARGRDLHIQAYRDDLLLVERDRPEAHQYADHAGIEITFVPDLVAAMGEVTPKLVIVAAAERMEALLPETRERWRGELFVTTSLPTFLEFTDVRSDKRSALEFLAAKLGFEPARAVAVGDGRNDRPMLEWAGLKVAIEGAPKELLEVADRTIPAPGAGGLAGLLDELLGEA
jgi:Cof subfamily protein (haloacid dehalogenase superfamily)